MVAVLDVDGFVGVTIALSSPLAALRVRLTTGRDCGEPRGRPPYRPSSRNSQPGNREAGETERDRISRLPRLVV